VDGWFSEIGSSTHAVFMSIQCGGQISTIIITTTITFITLNGHSTIFELYESFSDMLYSHYAVPLPAYQ
jgi:hypothetical protein